MPTNKTFNVSLDLKKSVTNNPVMLVSGDTGNILVITLTDNGTAVNLTNCRIAVIFQHPNGTYMQTSYSADGGVTIGGTDHNVITVNVLNESFSTGLVNCEIQVYSGSDYTTLVTTASFNFQARTPLVSDDVIESQSAYPILTQLISWYEGAIDEVETATGAANTAAGLANTKAGLADEKATLADQKATLADQKATAANTAAALANTKAGLADAAATSANNAADAANEAAQQALSNAQSNWSETDTTKAAYIKNKPTTMTPSVHAASHAAGGADAVTPASIGAAAASHASIHAAGGADAVTPASIGAAAASHAHAKGDVANLGATLLFDGAWGSGNITVTDFDKFNFFVLFNEGSSIPVFAYCNGTYLRGIGGQASANSEAGQQTVFFGATVSGTTLTFVASNYSSSPTTNRPIRTIYGIV